jgi:hypothetical protein
MRPRVRAGCGCLGCSLPLLLVFAVVLAALLVL